MSVVFYLLYISYLLQLHILHFENGFLYSKPKAVNRGNRMVAEILQRTITWNGTPYNSHNETSFSKIFIYFPYFERPLFT